MKYVVYRKCVLKPCIAFLQTIYFTKAWKKCLKKPLSVSYYLNDPLDYIVDFVDFSYFLKRTIE
jgi:hypothetical protein